MLSAYCVRASLARLAVIFCEYVDLMEEAFLCPTQCGKLLNPVEACCIFQTKGTSMIKENIRCFGTQDTERRTRKGQTPRRVVAVWLRCKILQGDRVGSTITWIRSEEWE